ncbi:MAG TPA: hypothetical protein VK922_17975 [Gemmatimonadaceae bacterium]|nr:hypothetical protein [Gemmatimonadaceae bacterium]
MIDSPIEKDSEPAAAPVVLSRELADLLVLLSISLNKHGFYPAGHPQLAGAAADVLASLQTLLVQRPMLTLGIARHQLLIDGAATDPEHPLLREMADRLHRHQIGAMQFAEGVTEADVHAMLQALAVDPDRSAMPLGLQENPSAGLRHITLHALSFAQLTLLQHTAGGPPASVLGSELWIGLARAALNAEQLTAEDRRLYDPFELASAIESRDRGAAYDQVIVGYLLQISHELQGGADPESAALRDRVSQLITSLRPETLARLLEMGGDVLQRRRFLLEASQSVAVDAVVELVEAAALASGQTISHAMARLLHKLAAHAAHDGITSHADGALREQVRRLVRGWTLADPNPDEYRQLLDRMARVAPEVTPSHREVMSEPERIVAMSLELELVEEPTQRAVQEVVERGGVVRLLELLDGARERSAAAARIWKLLTQRDPLGSILRQEGVDAELLARLVDRAGARAVDPLLDVLAESSVRSTRRLALEHLVSLGSATVDAAVARLPDAPWYVARNILILVRRVGAWPGTWSPAELAQHADPRVRREAIRLMLSHAAWRDRAIVMGMRDEDRAVTRAALIAASSGCPRSAVASLLRRLREKTVDDDLAPFAIRALAASGAREGLELAVTTVLQRTLFGRPRLATPRAEVLAAIAGLAAHWRDDPRAQQILALAAEHPDPTVRSAAAAPAAEVPA